MATGYAVPVGRLVRLPLPGRWTQPDSCQTVYRSPEDCDAVISRTPFRPQPQGVVAIDRRGAQSSAEPERRSAAWPSPSKQERQHKVNA
jgi:hypothetical protein